MFVNNHVGGIYYPTGSTIFFSDKLEKVIEENGGDMLLEKEVRTPIFKDGKPIFPNWDALDSTSYKLKKKENRQD